MTEYGDFIAKGPYVSGALTSIDIASAKDGRAGRLAIKRFHPPASRRMMRVLELEAWRLSLERQQRAARAGGAAVEVVATGSYPEGEYAVLPWQHRSLLTVVTSVSPTGDRLRGLTEGILAALRSWEQHFGTPHGNLKPTNVFLKGEGALQGLQYLLSDPAWRLRVSTAQLRRQELAQLGALIVQMVRGREAGSAPIEDAPEWRRLGRAGLAWRDYSNYLIDPNTPERGLTLDEAEKRLRAIPEDFRPGRVAVRGGAGAALVLCGAAVAYARLGEPRTMPASFLWLAEKTGNPHAVREQAIPEWPLLCRAWDDWVADLAVQAASLEGTKDLWSEPDSLRAAIANFRKKAENLRPDTMLPRNETEGRSLVSLARNPPDSVRRERVVRHILESWEVVAILQRELEGWPRWAELRSLRDEFAAAEKKEAFSRLESLVPERVAPGAKADPQATFNALAAFARNSGARALLGEWKTWMATAADLRASGDRVQVAMPKIVLQAIPDTRDLGEFVAGLTGGLKELRRRRALFLDPAVARDRFLKESPLQAEKNEVIASDLERWEREVNLFSRIRAEEDPRSTVAWDTRLAGMQANATDLEDELPTADAPAGVALLRPADYAREAERLRSEVKTLRTRDALRRDLPELAVQTREVETRVRTLEQRLEATLVLLRPDRWLARVAARTWPYEAAQARWDAWRREQVGNVAASVLEKDRPRFRRLRNEERQVRDWLAGLDGPQGLGTPTPLTEATANTKDALDKLNTRFRDRAVTALIEASNWKTPVPNDSFEETLRREGGARRALEAYRQWAETLPVFARDLDELGRMLGEGLSWSEGVADALARTTRHEGVNTVEGPPQSWLQTAQVLRDLAATKDLGALASAVIGGTLSTGLTAWRRLGELPEWPSNAAQLGQEVEFGTALRGKLVKLTVGARREKLETELARGQQERWLRAARSAVRQPPQVDGVFSQAAALGVTAETLEPSMAFNLRLWELIRESQNAVDLAQLKMARDGFVAAIKQIADLNDAPEVETFLKAVSAVPLKEEGPAEKARTPRQAGWKEELSEDGRRLVTRFSNNGHKLAIEYQLIEPTDGTEAFFVGRRTVSVGEFLDLLSISPESQIVLDALPSWTHGKGTPPGDVVMAWRPRDDGSGLELNPSWFFRPGPLLKGQLDMHPPALAAAIDQRPDARSPLQYISPEVARLFAERVLGARLPSPREWKALCSGGGSALDGNFRSAAFETVWRYASELRSGEITLMWRPTSGAFAPAAKGGNTPGAELDDGRPWPGVKQTSVWPASVDDGPVNTSIVHLFGNIWVYLYDEERKEYYVAGGSILSPPTIDLKEPQRLQTRSIIGRRGAPYGDGFTDVGLRPAFDAPASVRQRLQFFRLVRTQPFITK